MVQRTSSIVDLRYPQYDFDSLEWIKYRECYEGGINYTRKYLDKYDREQQSEFNKRKNLTPVPAFAKAAVTDVKNSIFQRMVDVVRRGGSKNYMDAVQGFKGGIDNKGSTMQSFMGQEVLKELVVMGRCGIYVDAPQLAGPSLADAINTKPYVYHYAVEDILAWTILKPEEPGEFQAVLLRDHGVDFEQNHVYGFSLPTKAYIRYRMVWINEMTGKVNMLFFNNEGDNVNMGGSLTDSTAIELDLERIPFTMPDIGGSLLKDVLVHQAALLNLGSSDINYALKANFPFYVEQQDMRAVGAHLKQMVEDDGSTGTTRNEKPGAEISVGASHGRAYDMKAERPAFINPSSEPLLASIKLEEKLEDDIRKLVNLAVQNKIGQRAMAAESLKISSQGIEAGLANIGTVLESAEKQVAQFWAAYEEINPVKRKIAIVQYPERYNLIDNKDRIEEASKLSKLIYTVPGSTVKRELSKNIVTILLSGKVDSETLDKIFNEIDDVPYTTSDPQATISAQEAGLVGEKVASMALGYGPEEYLQARKDHTERIARILEAQTKSKEQNAPQDGDDDTEGAQARGVQDLAVDKGAGKKEKASASDTTLKGDAKKPVRGSGKKI